MLDLRFANQAFECYLDGFDRTDGKINLKIIHTKGVVSCAGDIARRMRLCSEDCQLAELIGLLHDIGRFEQLRRFDSFEPSTMDHAAYGVQILSEDGHALLRRFLEPDAFDDIILTAIAWHSAFRLPPIKEERTLLHARLIRDADKLDNCRVKLTEEMGLMLGMEAEEVGRQSISPDIWQACLRQEPILSAMRKTKLDYWVSSLCVFYDVNFPETAAIILEKDYVRQVAGRIPYADPIVQEQMARLQDDVTAYLKALSQKACR